MQQWPWNGANCQRWTINATPDGYYEILSNVSGLALDVDGCLSTSGRNVQTWTSSGANCQRWGFEEVEPGYFKIISKNGLKVLDVSECSTADGANVQQWTWLGGDCQRWSLQSVSQSQRIVTGVEELESESKLTVYPNPVADEVQIRFGNERSQKVELRITNTAGQEVYYEEFQSTAGSNYHTLDLSSISRGIYFISITSDELQYTQKLIKK